jgi:hypothetical protein
VFLVARTGRYRHGSTARRGNATCSVARCYTYTVHHGPAIQPGDPFRVYDIHMYITVLYCYLRYSSVTIIYPVPRSLSQFPGLVHINTNRISKAASSRPSFQELQSFLSTSDEARSPLVNCPPDAARPGYNYREYYPAPTAEEQSE